MRPGPTITAFTRLPPSVPARESPGSGSQSRGPGLGGSTSKRFGGGCQRKHPPTGRASGPWGVLRLELPERQRGPHPLLARGSNTGGRNGSTDPPVYAPRHDRRGTYRSFGTARVHSVPCEEASLRGAVIPPHGTAPGSRTPTLSLLRRYV